MANISQEIKKGAFWVLLFSLIGGPLALLRNWLITLYDPSGAYIADFALVMILFNMITSFFMFGGSSVLTNFVPKIENEDNKFSFLMTYSIICILLFSICYVVLIFFPSSISYLTNGKVNESQNTYILIMSLPVILAQVIIYYLQGQYKYKKSSFLTQFPVFLNTGVILILISFHIPKSVISNQASFILFISSLMILSSIFSIIITLPSLLRGIDLKKIKLHLPTNFWSFSFYVHLMTIITFIYQNVDQIFVLKIVGIKELGYYFIIIQLVEVVRFIPLKIGQVLLASFSKIIHSGDEQLLISTYNKVSRVVMAINLSLSIILICYSSYILRIFHVNGVYYQLSFGILLIGYNISCIGNINSMVLLARNLSRSFFINNLIVVIILILCLYLFTSLNLIGVIAAKSISILIGQLGLFYLIRKHFAAKIGINKDYAFSQIFMIVVAALFLLIVDFSIFFHIALSLLSLIFIYKYYNFSIKELKALLTNKS